MAEMAWLIMEAPRSALSGRSGHNWGHVRYVQQRHDSGTLTVGVDAKTLEHGGCMPLALMNGTPSQVSAGALGGNGSTHRLDDARGAPEAALQLHLELCLVLLQLALRTRATREGP